MSNEPNDLPDEDDLGHELPDDDEPMGLDEDLPGETDR
jgi:hypothetical protein